MDRATYAVESQIEQDHWWFVGRRRLFAEIVAGFCLAPDAAIMDVGTSTGTNLRLLKNMGFTNYSGLDAHPEAIRWCAEKGLGQVRRGDLCAMPFEDTSFDLVLATDVLEHVDDDVKALTEIRRVLRPGGWGLITVPAFPSLWGLQDEISHHKRRYRLKDFLARIKLAGFHVVDAFYFNWVLFIPIWLARKMIGLFKLNLKSENELNNPYMNRLLTTVFSFDVAMARRVHMPFGVSIMAIVSK